MAKPKLICICGTEIQCDWNEESNNNDDYCCDCPKCKKRWIVEDCTKWAGESEDVDMVTMQEVRQANRTWFSDGNQKFFGDVSYRIVHSVSGKPYLARSTYVWSDMFGGNWKLHWRLNPIDDVLKIKSLIDGVFPDLDAVEDWLKDN